MLTSWQMGALDNPGLLTKFPPAENIFLDTPLVVMDSGFRVILWYIPDGLSPWVQNNMYAATMSMGDLLKKSVTTRKGSGLTPRGINIASCWFQQGHECYGPLPNNLEDGFKPEVSATLKGERSLSMIMDMQRPTLLASTALRVIHPQLYWASIKTQIELGRWSGDQGMADMHHLLKYWASVYTGAAVMCNHQSPDH
ncbi:hypothetical protein F4604DRAFT_1932697 [Suillus subluteus]|nr:hypothetical protein F4604DRAFT_1932697 [Suillus subluteus]